MAEAFSNWGNHYGSQNLRAHVVAWTEYTDDDHYKIVVTGNTQCNNVSENWHMQSQVGYDARSSGIPGTSSGAGSQSSSWAWCTEGHTFETPFAGSGDYVYADYHREDFGPFACDAAEHNVSVWYKCWAAGSWAGGQRDAFVTLTAPRYRQRTPRSPKNFTAARASDNSQKLAWTGDYTGWEGHYTWAYVHVERKDGDGSFRQVARVDWNVTNWTDNTTIPGWKYTYRLRASNWDGAFSDYTDEITLFTTPNGLGGLAIEKTDVSVVRLTGSVLWGWRSGVYAQCQVGGGEWADVSVTETAHGVWVDPSAPAGTVRYRIAAYVKQGGSTDPTSLLRGPWTATDEVSTVCVPNAPAVTCAPAAVMACPGTLEVSWAPDHPDGSAQTEYQVMVSGDQEAVYAGSGADTSRFIPLDTEGTYSVRVRTKGLVEEFGPWSPATTIKCLPAPSVRFTSPATPYDGTNPQRRLPIRLVWESFDKSGIAMQSLAVSSSSGIVWSKALGASDRSIDLGAEIGFSNGSDYTVLLTVTGGSGLTETAVTTVHTDWAQPVPPEATISYGDDLSASVSVEAAIDDTVYYLDSTALRGPMAEEGPSISLLGAVSVEGGALTLDGVLGIESYDLVRVDAEGGRTRLGAGLALGYRVVDALPPLNVDFVYEVTVRTALGTVASKEFAAYLDSKGMEAFNFGAAAQSVVKLGLNAENKENVESTGESYYFALGADTPALPTFYPDGALDSGRSLSYVVHTRDEYEFIRRLARSRDMSHFWYRDFWGHRMYAHGKWSFGYSAQGYSLWDVSVSPEEVVWKEPINGE